MSATKTAQRPQSLVPSSTSNGIKTANSIPQRSNPALIQRPPSKRNLSTPLITNPLAMKPNYFWQKWDSITVEVGMLPLDETTYNLWRNFEKFGSISFLEIFEVRGKKTRRGKIRFSPPPAEPFWPSPARRCYIMCSSEDGEKQYQVEVDPKLRDPAQIQSPINKKIFYDPTMKLKAASLHFGITITPGSFMSLATVQDAVSLTLDLRRRQITINFSFNFRDPRHHGKPLVSETKIGAYDRINKYMFRIPFDQLKNIQRKTHDSNLDLLIISLDCPPRFFRKREDNKVGHFSDGLRWEEFDTWFRQTDIMYDPYPLHIQKIALHKETPEIDIGRWTTYVFRAEKPSELMKQALSDFNINIIDIDNLSFKQPKKADLWSVIDSPDSSKTLRDLEILNEGSDGIISLPFEVRYQLEVCISRDILNEHNITREFVQTLADMAKTSSLKARSILEYVTGQGVRVYDPMQMFNDQEARAFTAETDIPHYCAFVRKATITPTTIYFSSPSVETTNRVLRHYARENRDGRFLRVQFTDELSQGRINPCADKSKDDELFTRVYRTLYNGIQIGDRTYKFLAFGGSQFRENGAYFFCPTEHLSCDDIRQWMGNFSHIPVVAKYAARLGQCFSTTRAINGLSKPDIVLVPDIERESGTGETRATYCFSDGVGKISPFLAQMITAELNLRTKLPPSAFQFRLGGCKGILVVWPDAKDKEVHIRKSQQKFTAIYNGLEIIRCSRFSIATLNRQTITILSALGVDDDVFIQMLSEQLENYQKAMDDDDLAVNLLLRYIDDNQMTINIATMIRNGFMAQKDPFVLSLLHLWRAWSIKLLKEKARIVVENGAFLFGCVDETGTLKGHYKDHKKEDLPEIFIQVPDKTDPDQYKVIVGTCLIGRNPSLHPGDLRVVKAVDIPQLRHLRDVVVLPSTGDRDIAGMCSGGDLDGDDYFVIWDEKLLPKEWNAEPMNYTASEPRKLNRPVQITDLMKFFVRYMKNDALRTIAPAHLANADYLHDSVKDPICLELAALHSKAVDYVKSGEAAQMPTRLRPKKWPHFMERNHKPKEFQYHSNKVLGKLYDRVERVNFVTQWEMPFDQRILQAYDLNSDILKVARNIKTQYDLGMRKIMNQQDISTEFEIWTTFVLSKPRVGNDYKAQEVIGALSDALKDQFRTQCIEQAGGKDFEILGPFVAAMYRVTKEELDIALEECRSTHRVGGQEVPVRIKEPKSMPLLSFPWLFEKELGRIATGIETSNSRNDLGLEILNLHDLGQRNRNAGKTFRDLEEDVIVNDFGDAIHRGEMLDLFHQNESESFNSIGSSEENYEKVQITDYKNLESTQTKPGANNVEQSLLVSETGVEDVVPQRALDGLIDKHNATKSAHVVEENRPKYVTISSESHDQKEVYTVDSPTVSEDKITATPNSPPLSLETENVVEDSLDSNLAASHHKELASDQPAEPEIVEEIIEVKQTVSAMDRLVEMYGVSETDSDSEEDA
ncbi:RNA-dependent RNA polymerase 1 [Podosphaera aphanis]|nr:RNA-dependent RNA polymerase 1 [Podosphaera aphanis]